MLDLYYRAHWYAREGSLKGFSTGVFNLDIIVERRKALEWISDSKIEDWDDVDCLHSRLTSHWSGPGKRGEITSKGLSLAAPHTERGTSQLKTVRRR